MHPLILDADGSAWLKATAIAAGFDLAGLAPVPPSGSPEATAEQARFAAWLAEGNAGEMEWLKRTTPEGAPIRGDLRSHLPWARSVLVCGVNYNTHAPRSIDPAPPTSGWIARYAWSGQTSADLGHRETGDGPDIPRAADYHDVLLDKLRLIEIAARDRCPGVETRPYVDTGPILERSFATAAGLGWIAKNTCVINQGQGSWLLLAVLVTSLELAAEAVAAPPPDRCGTCTRCIDACPTRCIHEPTPADPVRRLDATRCISYLTIEKKGAVDPELRPLLGRQVFGCDICQDVCPWNRRAPVAVSPAMPPRAGLINPELDSLASLDGHSFNLWFRGSPLERTRRKRLLRNVAYAMGNTRDPRFRPRLTQLAAEPDPSLSEAAQWALAQLPSPEQP